MKIEIAYRYINQEWRYNRHFDMNIGIFTLQIPDEILEVPLEPKELQKFVNTLITEACNARKLQKAIGDVAGSSFVVFPDPDGHQPKEMDTFDSEAQDFYEKHLPKVEPKPLQGFEDQKGIKDLTSILQAALDAPYINPQNDLKTQELNEAALKSLKRALTSHLQTQDNP